MNSKPSLMEATTKDTGEPNTHAAIDRSNTILLPLWEDNDVFESW